MENKFLPFISVVVPVYNQERYISKCIESLLNLDYPSKRLEIILVDNDSQDSSYRILKCYEGKKVKVIKESKRGPASARNKGIKESKGEIIAFTDGDCEVSRSWLKCLIKGLKENKADAVAGISIFCGKRGYVARVLERRGFDNLIKGLSETRKWITWAPTRNFAVKREILERLGGFCEDFTHPADEDIELCLRMQKNGYRILFVPEASVFHYRANYLTLGKAIKKCFWEGFSHCLLLLKFPEMKKISPSLALFFLFLTTLGTIFTFPFNLSVFLFPIMFLILYLFLKYLILLPKVRTSTAYTLLFPVTLNPLEFLIAQVLFFSQEIGFLFACFKYRRLNYIFYRFIPEESFALSKNGNLLCEITAFSLSLFVSLLFLWKCCIHR